MCAGDEMARVSTRVLGAVAGGKKRVSMLLTFGHGWQCLVVVRDKVHMRDLCAPCFQIPFTSLSNPFQTLSNPFESPYKTM